MAVLAGLPKPDTGAPPSDREQSGVAPDSYAQCCDNTESHSHAVTHSITHAYNNIHTRAANSHTLGGTARLACGRPLLLWFFLAASSGARIAYAKKDRPRGEPNQLMIANSDGTDARPLFGDQVVAFLASPTWSPDGSKIAFTKGWLENANGIYVAEVPIELRP